MTAIARALRYLFAVVLCCCGAVAQAQQQPSAIGYSSVAEALAALRADPAATESQQDGWTLFARKKGLELWSFTPDDHPAHPSAAKRTAYQDDSGGWRVETRLLCQSTKASCDALMEQYQHLDARMKDRIRKEHGSGT